MRNTNTVGPHVTMPPTAPRPEIPCPQCGVIDHPTIGPGNGPHAYRALCRHCGAFLQWLSTKAPEARQLARQQALEARPPTAAQLAYLAVLGDQAAPPGNLWDASQRIDALVRGEGKP